MSRVTTNVQKAEVAELGILLADLARNNGYEVYNSRSLFSNSFHFTGHLALDSGMTLWMMNSKQRKGVLSLAKEGKIEVRSGRAPNKPPCSEANKRKRALRELKTKIAKRKAKLAEAKEKEQRLREEGLALEEEIVGLEAEMTKMSESVPKLDET
ncbi:hypothetical protein TWF102_005751 [Orbilia oligospora]|uniref:Uncharacterized protein n=1 Tax=Orbilia oligospora TaxID=2813651 RepID=A0A7C8JIZ2_ORBOL|nr:hypothetical protein TWF102_005751 [Orbilia oligospora]KAF3113235.1 hypothetical protein TWF103_002403 [Orbilia oligospora]